MIYAPKIEIRTQRVKGSKHPLNIDHIMYPHTLLIDLEAVNANALDINKFIKDCDLLKEVAIKDPEKLKTIVGSFASDAPHENMLKAFEIAKQLGLTEDAMAEKGGGFLVIIVILAALAMSSCKGCAHTKGSMRQNDSADLVS